MLTLTFFLIFISHFRDKDETDDIENKQTAAIREGTRNTHKCHLTSKSGGTERGLKLMSLCLY